MKKALALLLVTSISFGSLTPAFAATNHISSNNTAKQNQILIKEEKIYVDDGDGNSIEVIVSEYSSNSKSPRSLSPEYEQGETKSYEFKISNYDLGLPGASGAVAGQAISKTTKKKIATAVTKVLGEKIGSKFIPGLNLASSILTFISVYNGSLGNDGFIIYVDLEYSSVFIHKEGIYMYGWDITNIDVDTY